MRPVALTAADVARMCAYEVRVPPGRFWWQCGDLGVRPFREHELVTGEPVGPFSRTDERDSRVVLDEMRAALRANGPGIFPLVTFAIDPRGRCVLTDGGHRTAAALLERASWLLGGCVYRSAEWWALRYALIELHGGTTLYQPIDHPDFAGWPVFRADTARRAQVIGDALEGRAPRIVEVGCCSGAVSLALARRGFDVRGIDLDGRAIQVARLIAKMDTIGAEGGRVVFRSCSAVPFIPTTDAVVCLSMLNHYLLEDRREHGHEILRRCVAAAPLVVLDCPAPDGGVNAGSEFVDPARMLTWCAAAGVPGRGRVLAERGDGLQRTLIVWER